MDDLTLFFQSEQARDKFFSDVKAEIKDAKHLGDISGIPVKVAPLLSGCKIEWMLAYPDGRVVCAKRSE